MRGIPRPACLAVFAVSFLGWQPAVSAAQFFEFNFEVAGYQDITGREFSANADDGVVGEITNTSLHIQIVGTDNNADGRLEPQNYSAIWKDDFGTVQHSLDNVKGSLGTLDLKFTRPPLNINSLALESHPHTIAFGTLSPNQPFWSFLSSDDYKASRACGLHYFGSNPCYVTQTAREVPEYLSPLASVWVLGLGVWLKRKFNSRRATSEH